MRSVTVLEVVDASVWEELAARAPIDDHLGPAISPLRREVLPSFEAELQPLLGLLVRYPRRAPEEIQAATAACAALIATLPAEALAVLHAAQRHALDDVVHEGHAWDPVADADAVRSLLGRALLERLEDGRFRLHADLPPPPARAWDFDEAVMDETDDLSAPGPGPVGLLTDVAALAAAVEHVRPQRTYKGTLVKTDQRKLGQRLGGVDLDEDRWARAFRALEALRVVSVDPLARVLELDLGLERTLAGEVADAVDALLRRLVEPELHGALEAVREGLRQAAGGALDELVFFELLRDQSRELVFPAWRRDGERLYPLIASEAPRLQDDAAWEKIEVPTLLRLLRRLERMGVVRRAPGVIAATVDGRVWARATQPAQPPVWVTSDLEVMVPPNALTPWERFHIERLGRCLSRDVVDRLRLERPSLETWLATHEVDEALELLRRRCPGVPASVVDTLSGWARSATRAVLWRGVLLA